MRQQTAQIKGWIESVRRLAGRDWHGALQWREKLSISEEGVQMLIAAVVGLMGGVVNVLFYLSIDKVQYLIVGHPGKNIDEVSESLPLIWRFITPAFGGLAAGAVLYWGLRLAGKPRTTNLLEVVVAGDGRLPFRGGLVRGISSLISIGSGGSIGREGGITQLSATAASKWGQIMNWQPYRLRMLVACGAAAGMSAAYNAPITGAIFAAQIVLGNFSMNLFAPLLCSSVVASVMSRSFFGIKPWYQVPPFEFTHIAQLPWFLVLGLLAGIMGAVFLKLLQVCRELFQRVPFLPLRMAVGGALVGIIALLYPDVWGNGYYVASRFIQHPMGTRPLLELFLAKLLATGATVGSGAVGGVITPTLFLGAGLGSLMGATLRDVGLAPDQLPIGIFALVGMGSVFSATTRSPLLAIVMILEISLNYSIMPALMLGCAVSTLVSRRLHPSSVYTESKKLKSREVEESRLGAVTEQTIGDLMRRPVKPVRENATLPQIAERFLTSQNNFIPVVDNHSRLVGVVALLDLKEFLRAGPEMNLVIAGDVMRGIPPVLRPGLGLMAALPVLLASEQRNVPVVNTMEEKVLIGSVVRAEALALLSEAIAASSAAESGNSDAKADPL